MIYFRRRLSSFGFLLVVLPGVVVIGVFCTLQHFILTQDDSLSLLGTPASLRQLTEKQIRFSDLAKTYSNSSRKSSFTTSSYSTLGPSKLFKIGFNVNSGNYTEFWSSVRLLAGNDCLYPQSYDATEVTGILRNSKIIYADLFTKQTSLKLKMRFEGNQSAIFKIMLVERENKSRRCNHACEHPEYEVTAFTINRMFDLRNMPYTTGRIISWFDELAPVATSRLREFLKVKNDKSVCFNWTCLRIEPRGYCFKDGMIPGAVMYFVEDKEIDFIRSVRGKIYHGYHLFGAENKADLQRLPGDKTFCKKFRRYSPYTQDRWFLDLVDIAVLDYLMSHIDAKHTALFLKGNRTAEFNVMIDFGHTFCRHDSLAVLAPLIQCCRIRTRLFQAMVRYRDTLEEMFLSLTQDDPLHPLLIPENMRDVKQKLKQTLALIEFCRNLDGDSNVFIDL